MRPIDTLGYAKLTIPESCGERPKLDWLPIASLMVDPEYQREISGKGRRNIRRIAENFNWSMFGTVMVAKLAGGFYAIVDGQHRTTAAALCGFQKVPCQIIEAPRGEQAAAFRAINGNTTRPHAIQLFHASVAAGEANSLQVVAVCKLAGVRIARSLQTCRDYETFCIASIGKGIARYGEALVVLALRMIVASGDGRAEDLNRAIISATIEVLARHPEWQKREAELKATFQDVDLVDLWRSATAEAARVKGTSSTQILERKLTKKLERGLERVPA